MPNFARTSLLPALVYLLAAAPELCAQSGRNKDDPVKVEKGDVKVQYKTFDPRNLPDPPPPLTGDEAAVCVYSFGVESNVKYSFRAPANRGAGAVSTNIELGGVDVRLSLSIVIWLPTDATPQLKAHEEGHRTIAEHYFKDAEQIARRHARQVVVGRKIPIRAGDLEAAARAEMEKVNKQICDKILADMEGPCAKAQDVYDDITDHGRKARPTSEEAVRTSIERAGGKGK